jgi:hypothetical protein
MVDLRPLPVMLDAQVIDDPDAFIVAKLPPQVERYVLFLLVPGL